MANTTNEPKEKEVKLNKKIKLFNQQIDGIEKMIGKEPIESFPENKKQVVQIKNELEFVKTKYGATGRQSSRNSAIATVAILVGVIGVSLLLFYPFAILALLKPGTMLAGAGLLMFTSLMICSIRPLIRSIRYKRYEKKAIATKARCEKILDSKLNLQDTVQREKVLEQKFELANKKVDTDVAQAPQQTTNKVEAPQQNVTDEIKVPQQMVDDFWQEMMNDQSKKSQKVSPTEKSQAEEVNQEELVLEPDNTYSIANKENNLKEESHSNEATNNNVTNTENTQAVVEDTLETEDESSVDESVDNENTDENANESEELSKVEEVIDVAPEKPQQKVASESNDSKKTEEELKAEEFVVGNNKDEIVKVIIDPNNSAKTSADNSKYVFSIKYKVYNKQNKGPIKTTISVRENDLSKFIQAIGPKNSRLNNKINTIDTLSQLSKSAKKNGLKLELVIHATKMLEGKNTTFTSIPYTDGDKFLKIINTLRDSMVKIGTKQLEEEKQKQEEEFNPYYTK